jgi:hypothetical protein
MVPVLLLSPGATVPGLDDQVIFPHLSLPTGLGSLVLTPMSTVPISYTNMAANEIALHFNTFRTPFAGLISPDFLCFLAYSLLPPINGMLPAGP